MLRLADAYFEGSGRVPYPEDLFEYDPVWLEDFATYRRIKRMVQKKKRNGQDED